jgi:hypothetical protein
MQALVLMGRATERKQGMDRNEEKLEALWYRKGHSERDFTERMIPRA